MNFSKNDISGSNSRATWDKEKIFRLLNYLINKKDFTVVVLGLSSDPSVKIIKELVFNKQLEKKVFFLLEISNKYSFIDQLSIAKNSSGYLGNGSGVAEIFYYLKKKALVFDHVLIDYLLLPHFKKYRKTIFKSYSLEDKSVNILSQEKTEWLLGNKEIKYEIIENSFEDIVIEIENYLIKSKN